MNPNFLPPGHLLNQRYSIQYSLGQGGFGITYLAYDTVLNQEVCIKELFVAGNSTRGLDLSVHSHSIKGFSFDDFVSRFVEEARKLAQFRHPNIVRVLDVFQTNQTAYMVMDYIKGETLKQKVQSQGKLTDQEARGYIDQLLAGVEEVHKKGMLHRDIKPDNILITEENKLVLIDFGSAREFTEGRTITQTAILTPGYAPMEQYSDKAKRGPFTDIYSIGATIYFMVTGEKPLAVTDRSFEELISPKKINTDLSEHLSIAILKAMKVKPSDRYQNIADLKDDLKNLKSESLSGNVKLPKKEVQKDDFLQIWNYPNLDVDKFLNGDLIPEARTEEEWQLAAQEQKPAWCFYNNDPAMGDVYGKLYNYHVLKDPRGIIASGFKIPSLKDWNKLIDYLGGGRVAGKKMKASFGWLNDGNGSDVSGFSGLPAGYRSLDGKFLNQGLIGNWWCKSEASNHLSWCIILGYYIDFSFKEFTEKGKGFSIRYIKV